MDLLLQFFAKFFVILFLAGAAGSMIVVILSFVEDLELLVESDDPVVDAPVRGA